VLTDMSCKFDRPYAATGQPSIPPERLLRAQLLQIFYSIRSERLLMEQLDYNLLFRWFVGLTNDDPVWDPTGFTKNGDRLLNQAIARSFFQGVAEPAQGLVSDEHFAVDGTLIEEWASQKSFQRKDGKTDGEGKNVRGQTRTNDTHASRTDPDAKLYQKSNGAESRLAYLGDLLIENRHGRVRLVENDRVAPEGEIARREEGQLARAVRERRVQPDPVVETAATSSMTAAPTALLDGQTAARKTTD
jgi:transposase